MIGGTVGGGFGGKVDVIVEPVAFLASMITRRPVKYAYSREEEMQVSSPRAAERIYIKDGVMKDGTSSPGNSALCRRRRLLAPQPLRHDEGRSPHARAYSIPNVHVDAHCVYTNRTPSSAMRGFGVTIGDFALEVQMDKLARLVGMDPLEFRFKNAYRDGDMKAHGEDYAWCGAHRDHAGGIETRRLAALRSAAERHRAKGRHEQCAKKVSGRGVAARQLSDRHESRWRSIAGPGARNDDGEFRRHAVER